ncbi:hypothetical protein [Sphingomonas sp. ERG5]|uniref:hypothetical protein n=1 Tax=Sphingomonas sp. ERG5 TaxID=1381597 RepID=UPI00054C0C59|nr:hypothetical protein [Sphingomonas sp. ERG5]
MIGAQDKSLPRTEQRSEIVGAGEWIARLAIAAPRAKVGQLRRIEALQTNSRGSAAQRVAIDDARIGAADILARCDGQDLGIRHLGQPQPEGRPRQKADRGHRAIAPHQGRLSRRPADEGNIGFATHGSIRR